MKTIFFHIQFILIFFLSSGLQATEREEKGMVKKFQQAVALQKKNQVVAALQVYRNLEKSGIQSDELFFNMGNCYYQLKSVGLARAYYEKALVINPLDKEAEVNLNLNLREIQGEKFRYLAVSDNFLRVISKRNWLRMTAFFILIAALAYVFSVVKSKKSRFAKGLAIVSILFSMLTSSVFFYRKYEAKEAVIVTQTQGKIEPFEEAKDVLTIENGAKLTIVRDAKDWKQVAVDKANVWVKTTDLVVINP